MRFGASGKGCCLLVPHANPWNLFALAKRICDSVQRVASDSINSLDSRSYQHIHEHFRDVFLSHCFVHQNPELRSPANCRMKKPSAIARRAMFGGPSPSSVRAPTIHLPELGICISVHELIVFAKRTSFVVSCREFLAEESQALRSELRFGRRACGKRASKGGKGFCNAPLPAGE
jgi:hypothetical protein